MDFSRKYLKAADMEVGLLLNFGPEPQILVFDAYLVACLETDSQNILYSYDHDFDRFNINRKEP